MAQQIVNEDYSTLSLLHSSHLWVSFATLKSYQTTLLLGVFPSIKRILLVRVLCSLKRNLLLRVFPSLRITHVRGPLGQSHQKPSQYYLCISLQILFLGVQEKLIFFFFVVVGIGKIILLKGDYFLKIDMK